MANGLCPVLEWAHEKMTLHLFCAFSGSNHLAALSMARKKNDDDDVYYYICWRLKLEGETENIGVCTKERKGVAAEVLMATPCTNSLGESGTWRGGGGDPSCLGWSPAQISPAI